MSTTETVATIVVKRSMEDMHLNLSLYTTPLYGSNSNSNDVIDYDTLDGTIDGAYGNYSDPFCPSIAQNLTYLNVSCDTTLNFSEPLFGMYSM